ncbi:hypothetical protein [Teredinibacter sp. KSP-S5-2]|uniref:hypothetical protein n=1 Tax=Teredinibacter sp. KSP-S5-2 TaxID=3034506 RepID=UPI002934A9F2|nr:hypothetical protein [Teredinibacter sp. KSP-S5-2]WNO11554.1 hypothetical protein P5V12_10260 [Teredinibacter sp. KSP-S5-2]
MSTDWVAEYFTAMKDCGEDISIIYGRLPEGEENQAPEWFELPHDKYDGISGMAYLLRNAGFSIDVLPSLKNDSYRFFKSVKGILSVLPHMGMRQQKWVRFDRSVAKLELPVSERIAWHLFSEQESQYIVADSKKLGVTVNSYLLFHLDRAVSKILTSPEDARKWMVPVNMRGAVSRKNEYTPQMSFLGVDTQADTTLTDIHGQVLKAKSKAFHWGAWAMFNAGFLAGKEGIRKDIKKRDARNHSWTGTFSNLGVWNIPGAGSWLFGPTTGRTYPVAAGCISMNKRIGITVQLHEALLGDIETAYDVVDLWSKHVLSGNQESEHSPKKEAETI